MPDLQAHLVRHDTCANAACSNRVGEGVFTTLAYRNMTKPVVLVVCAPCAVALMGGLR